jgi:hypothetical protein
MDNTKALNRKYELMAWGVFFLWWGIIEFKFLPHGTGDFGIGLIFLGLNAIRFLKGIPTSGWTIALGILMLADGILELAGSVLNLPFKLPIFAILLIVLGMILVAHELLKVRKSDLGNAS